jgi:hypothetical protein
VIRKCCRLFLCLAFASAATISNFVFSAHAQQVRGFSADLSFTFHCSGDASREPSEAIERFLRENGFKVLNVVRLLRERKLPPLFSDLMIDGVDESQHRMVRFMSTPFEIGWYQVQFFTRPPTQHDEVVENQLLMFASETLGCPIGRRVDRRENGSERRFYYKIFKQTRNKIREGGGEL